MKVVLLEDVKALGKKGELVEVSDGYARNFILPKKKGMEATAKNLNDLKLQKQHQDKLAAEQLAEAKALAEKIDAAMVVMKVKTGEGGKVFGSVSTKEIAQAAKEQCGFDMDNNKMVLEEPIKSCGNHIIPVKLHREVTAKLTVKVTEG